MSLYKTDALQLSSQSLPRKHNREIHGWAMGKPNRLPQIPPQHCLGCSSRVVGEQRRNGNGASIAKSDGGGLLLYALHVYTPFRCPTYVLSQTTRSCTTTGDCELRGGRRSVDERRSCHGPPCPPPRPAPRRRRRVTWAGRGTRDGRARGAGANAGLGLRTPLYITLPLLRTKTLRSSSLRTCSPQDDPPAIPRDSNPAQPLSRPRLWCVAYYFSS